MSLPDHNTMTALPKVPAHLTKHNRGIRNHNPGNIDYNAHNNWRGQLGIEIHAQPRFARFKAPEYGIRALVRLLNTYFEKHGLNTIYKIVSRWAPPNENNTEEYANFVGVRVGISPYKVITELDDYDVLFKLVEAIITKENGYQPYSVKQINKGISMAGFTVPATEIIKRSANVKVDTTAVVTGTTVIGTVGADVLSDVAVEMKDTVSLLDAFRDISPAIPYICIALLVGFACVRIYLRFRDAKRGL